MLLFRPIQSKDLDALYRLALLAGIGVTTLPPDKKVLLNKIAHSLASFNKTTEKPLHELYFFVLEDLTHARIIGSAAIEAAAGYDVPFYSYRVAKATSLHHALSIRHDYEFLTLVNDYQGKTEICSLMLDPNYRQSRNGTLLSRSRFIFMAQFPQRFADVVFAEMRGVTDEHGYSPFWESLGRHFFLMDFHQADQLTLITNKQFIADLMPRKPIYTLLLSKEAQQVIAKPHPSTVPAFNILRQQGFVNRGYIDIFDAGPTIEAPLAKISTIKRSKECHVSAIATLTSPAYIIGNTQLEFKATLGQVELQEDGSCKITAEVANVLQVEVGSKVRIVAF